MIVKELFAKLGLEVDESGFTAADAIIGGVKTGLLALTGMAVAGAGALAGLVIKASESAHHLDLVAQRAGISASSLQGLAYVGGLVDLSMEDIAGGMASLVRHMAKAAGGSDEAAKAFSKYGIAVKGTDGKLRNADEVFLDIADKLAGMPDGAEKSAAAMGMLGKSGSQFLPLLNKGKDGIKKFVDEAKSLGGEWNDDQIEKNGELTETLYRLNKAMLSFPARKLIAEANELALSVLEWYKANRELVKSRIDKVATVLKVVLGALLFVLKGVFTVTGFVVDNFKFLALILSSVVLAAIVVNAGALFALAEAYLAAGAAGVAAGLKTAATWLIANAPLIIVAAALLIIILLFEDINTAMKGGKSLLKEWLGDWKDDNPDEPWWLRDFKALIYAVFHFDELMIGLKLLWSDFWKWLEEGWDGAAKMIMRGLKRVLGLGDDDIGAKDTFKAGEAARRRADQKNDAAALEGGGIMTRDEKGNIVYRAFGDGESPEASAAGKAAAGGDVKVSTFKVNQNIVAAPGQSPQEVANASANALDDWHQDQLETAASHTAK